MLETPRLGWMADPPEGNGDDWIAELSTTSRALDISLEHLSPPIMNQGRNGSCVWQVVAGLIYAEHVKQGVADPELLSRMRGWWLCRFERGLQGWNVGCWLRQAFRKCNAEGFCRERYMPHSRHNHQAKPSKNSDRMSVDQNAKNAPKLERNVVEYRRILPTGAARVEAFRQALADGHQIGAGWDVPKRLTEGTFDPDEPFDVLEGEPMAGGHAMRIEGVNGNGFIVPNSWGTNFGRGGRFIMSPSMARKARDPWIVLSAPYFSDLS